MQDYVILFEPELAVAEARDMFQRYLTGWAMDEKRRNSAPKDHWIPLSDHADFDQLLSAVEQVSPKSVFCTHGPKSFVEELRKRGHDARWLK